VLNPSRYGKLESLQNVWNICGWWCWSCVWLHFEHYYKRIKWLDHCLVCYVISCRRIQWRELLNSPKRACLAYARLAGARLSIFGTKGRPGDPLEFWASDVSLRRGESRLSENTRKISVLEVELLPRRGKLAWARVLLAWARSCCLSEKLGEKVASLEVFLDLKCDYVLGWLLPLRIWAEWLLWMGWYKSYDLCVLTWCEYDICMRWFMKLRW